MTEYHDVPEIKAMKSTIISNFRAEEVPENKLTLFSIIWDNTPLRVFAEVGLSDFMASLIAAISPTVQWMGSWVCIPTIERIGRRKIMIFTASIETCCMLVFIVLNMIENETDTTQWASAMIMFPYLFFYGWGWVGCPWIYGPEVFNIIAFIFVYFMCLDVGIPISLTLTTPTNVNYITSPLARRWRRSTSCSLRTMPSWNGFTLQLPRKQMYRKSRAIVNAL